MNTYVILLRGINVGGKNKVPMSELKLHLEKIGFSNVKTYINSGNVLLDSDESAREIKDLIEDALPQKFELTNNLMKILVLSHPQLKAIIDKAPEGFGDEPDNYHSDVIFLIGITTEDALKVFDPREGVDRISPGNNVIFSQRLSEKRTKSRLSKIMGTPSYKSMTIRTWSTVIKLEKLAEPET